ncbi:MAG TPA: hypothetical protein VNJ08_03595 [Bacteriovoracaceae bacterium]|nr:hypothetical protein [Bacteriovoracaceae bacterium]
MELQQLLNNSDLHMTLPQVKAFFLGILSAEKPMPYNKAVEELLAEVTEGKEELAVSLKVLFEELSKNKKAELADMFKISGDFATFLESSKEQLDYFLTALSLSGTNVETLEDEDLSEIIDELEDTVMELEDYLASDKQTDEESEELKDYLLGAWQEFIDNSTKP